MTAASRPKFSPRWPLAVRGLLCLALVVGVPSGALADTVKVTADRALVWNRPGGVVAVVIGQLSNGDVVDVVRRVGAWYEVILPTGTFSPTVRTGFVAAAQVAIDTVGPPSAEAARLTTPAPRPPRQPGTSFVNLSVLRTRGAGDLTQTVTVFSESLDENSTITTNYGNATGWGFEFMAGGPVWHALGIGLAIDYRQAERSAAVDALVPHPYFFNEFRSATFATEPVKARQTAFHIPAIFMPQVPGAVRFMAYAGPSIFRVSQSVVTGLILAEQYPYDIATISGVTTTDRKSTSYGYHAGADVSVFVNRSAGVGGGIRFSHANIKPFDDDTATTTGTAGGVSVAGGIRLRF